MERLEQSCDVLFLIGCWEGESKRYRVHNVIEGLESLGYSAAAMDFARCGEIVDRGLKPRVVVFFRSPFDPAKRIVEVLEYCRVNKIRTVFDVDDYVFEPEIIDSIAGVEALSPEQRVDYEWGVRAYRALLFSCERATTTTPFLLGRMRELGRDSHLIPNSVNRAQQDEAERLRGKRRLSDGTIRICYFSGSNTHGRDFAECSKSLQALMQSDPRIVFRLVGLLDLDDSWIAFADRIERAGFMEPLEMLRSLAECDINLAPLEEGDMFCEGKSELKFFEAALVEVPTIASRTGPFRAAIADGQSGLLASTPEEWLAKLTLLANNPSLRLSIGASARTVALDRFSAETAARAALRAYGLEQPLPRLKRHEASLKIGWIVPGLIIGGGGHRNILRAAFHLERFGHDVRLYFSDTNLSDDELRKQVNKHFYPIQGKMTRFNGHVDKEDVLMATHWSTVALAQSAAGNAGEIIYFVQDFEPAFYPMGSEYILAENTYRQNLYAITSGPWCANILRRDYGMEADWFQFPVDRQVYRVSASQGRSRAKRILFFAKPEMPRRCFLIGAQALREFNRIRPDFEILFYGSGNARNHLQPYPVNYLDVVPTIADLARLYATSAAGLVFSTTNPSLVPYEMMACGLPVIDIDRPGNAVNYGGRTDIALLADPDPAKMAQSMAELLDDPDELAVRGKRSVEFVQSFPSEEEMARRVEALILARVGRPVPAIGANAAMVAAGE